MITPIITTTFKYLGAVSQAQIKESPENAASREFTLENSIVFSSVSRALLTPLEVVEMTALDARVIE